MDPPRDSPGATGGAEVFRLLVEGVKDYAIFLLDPAGRVATWNLGAERIKGYRAEEILGSHFSRFYPAEDLARGKPDEELRLAEREGRVEDEGFRLRKDGSRFFASVTITAMRDGTGRLVGFSKITRDLTERRRAEEARRLLHEEGLARARAEAGELHYRTMAESIPEIVWIAAPDGHVEYLNGRWYELTGMAPDVDPTAGWTAAMHPDDAGPCRERWHLCRDAQQPFEMEYRLRREDGEYLWHLGRAHPARGPDGRVVKWFGAATNIHGQKLAEQRALQARVLAEAAQERLRFVAEASVRLASSLDYDTTVRSVAQLAVPRLADWCAVDVLEAPGRLRSVAVAHADPAKVEWARELAARYPVDLDGPRGLPLVLRSGEPEFYAEIPDALLAASALDEEHLRIMRLIGFSSVIIAPLVARGRTFGALTLVQAESGRRYDEEDLRLAEDLALRVALAIDNARLYREAQEAIRVRENFLTIASHELKTPLTAMHLQFAGIQRALRSGADLPRERLAERLQAATRQVERLDRLVNDLLDVSRISAAGLSMHPEAMDLAELAGEVLARFTEELARAGCAVTLAAAGPVTGRWDRMRLEQVLTNLIGNAIKYGRGRPIEVTVEVAVGVAVGVAVRAEGGRARLSVRDHGIGIPREDQARVFERFERAVSDRNYGGFGLGLWIVKQLTEAMGGTILIESEAGAGSTFVIDLPRDAAFSP